MTQSERDANKATVNDILNTADELNGDQREETCPEPIPLSDFNVALRGAITDVYSTVTTAYDNDLLIDLAWHLFPSRKKKFQVLWKDETITRKTYDPKKDLTKSRLTLKRLK